MSMRYIDPPEHLQSSIIDKIAFLNERRSFRVKTMYSVLAVISFVTVFFTFSFLARESNQTGFAAYLSLVFTDISMLVLYSKEILLALAESLPSLAISAFLVNIISLLFFIRGISKTNGGQKIFRVRHV
jgi:hypothetical protein